MNSTGVPLYERLPEIYRIRDEEESPPGQLRALLAAVEMAFGAIRESIEGLHDDLFIDTCDDWVIPYLADLLGTTHLRGLPWTLRADVADTIALRRRKGTRAAIERLAANLTKWPCRAVEMFPNLAWNQHLNHQRPDAGGAPPYGRSSLTRFDVPRGGTAPIRDPAMLSLLGTPFDTFAYTADVKPADDGQRHINLPNLAIFLWRLAAYRIPVTKPLAKGVTDLGPPPAAGNLAQFAVRFDLDPLDRPVRLFNTHRPRLTVMGSEALTGLDAVPCPIPDARLTSDSAAGNPDAYVNVDPGDTTAVPPTGLDVSDVGLQLYVPEATFAGTGWKFRGDNLCAWETGLRRPLGEHEIVIDPDIGRVLFGVAAAAERDALANTLVGYTYGAVGEVGAHPISRRPLPPPFDGPLAVKRTVSALAGTTLEAALSNLDAANVPVIVEIQDSLTYDLDPSTLPGALTENGLTAIQVAHPLLICAADDHRPEIRLANPLAFRPVDPAAANVSGLTVRLEGVFLTRNAALAAANGSLVARAAVATLELVGCTLDPGGFRQRNGTRVALFPSLHLTNNYGFVDPAELDAFEPTPHVKLVQTIAGSLQMDEGYRLTVESSIVDAGKSVGEPSPNSFAIGSASVAPKGWGPTLDVDGGTFFGRVRVARISGSGGIFVHRLEAWDHQHGCLKQCYFRGAGDRLPPNHACVSGPGVKLGFTSSWFGDPGYGQLTLTTDARIRTRGPDDEPMGAFGSLREASRWANLNIRLREFMPVGVRPLVLPIT